jgi:hypothetical protein
MGSALLGNALGQSGSRYYGANNLKQGNDAAKQFEPVPEFNIPDASNYGPEQGVGYTPYTMGFTADNKPTWMKGWFDMPEWGHDRRGNPLTEADLRPAQPQQAAAAQQAAPQQAAPQQQYQPAPRPQDLVAGGQAHRGYVDAVRGASQAAQQGDWNAFLTQQRAAGDAKRRQMDMVRRWNAGERGQGLLDQQMYGAK